MLRQLIQNNDISQIPIIVLILFIFIVALVLLWMYRPGSNQLYQHIAQIPVRKGVSKDEI